VHRSGADLFHVPQPPVTKLPPTSTPYLRLVRDGARTQARTMAPPPATPDPRFEPQRRAVARENQAARHNLGLDPTDPRWKLALRAYAQLEGTALTPERRRQVERTAATLGVRPFEANVIMAIVQDHARHGRGLPDAAATLALLDAPATPVAGRASSDTRVIWLRWIAALAASVAVNAWLIAWILRG
jgi:hypothetical protein